MKRNRKPKKTIVTIRESDIEDLPSGAILFGGHPNWQKHFAEKFPDCKIIGPKSVNFNINIIARAPCVLLNAKHMSHSQYYRFMPVIKKNGRQIIYIV